jgi:hypothetical protein
MTAKADMAGYMKQVYDKLERAVPEWAEVQKRVAFNGSKRLGDTYNFPVKLRRAHGVTIKGGADVGTGFTLNAPKSLIMRNAQVAGSTCVVQEDIPYDLIQMAQQEGEAAFGDAMDEIVFGLRDTAAWYLEMCLLYGATDIGVISVIGGAGTTRTWTISTPTWAPGLWAGMEGALLDAYDPTLVTKRNTNADIEVTTVLTDTIQIFVTGNAADLTATLVNDRLVPKGCNGAWFAGIDKILTNTGSLFNIDASVFSLWKSNTFSAGNAKLAMAIIQSAATRGMVRGLDEEVDVLVGPYSWTDLNNDLAALRRFIENMKGAVEMGTKKITFHGVTGAPINLVPHPMVKTADAFMVPFKRVRRIGFSDITSKLKPGSDSTPENFYQDLENVAAIRIRNYWNQGVIVKLPSRCTKITNITPQSGP